MAFSADCDLLKNNKDYQELLRTLALLEAQKIQVIKDLESLEQLKAKVEGDPFEAYKALASEQITSCDILPPKQPAASLPEINWNLYSCEAEHIGKASYNTRKKTIPPSIISAVSTDDGRSGNGGQCSSTATATATTVAAGVGMTATTTEQQHYVHSRKEKKKNGSYGQPWTEEEQRRLEELLKIYPSEEIEAKRWQKIASALGNRTTKQVCCRVQKYFIKLAKAGLPVPGRMPNLATYSKKSRIRRSSTRQPSIFFNSLKPKVYMTNDPSSLQEVMHQDMSSDEITSSSSDSSNSSSDDDDDQQNERSAFSLPLASPRSTINSSDERLTCSGCHSNLDSIHWSCSDCSRTIRPIHLCLECVKSNWRDDQHLPSHDMLECFPPPTSSHQSTRHILLPPQEQFIDSDYAVFKQSSVVAKYNYLDPNFCPAL